MVGLLSYINSMS